MVNRIGDRLSLRVLLTATLVSTGIAGDVETTTQWEDPFVSKVGTTISSDSLTLETVLGLVAKANPTLKAGQKQIEASLGSLTQAGLRPNPEVEAEFEEVGWDASGLNESEISVLLSQEIELWGKRKNRKNLALTEIEATKLETAVAGFDIYAATVERFYTLAYAQRQVALAGEAKRLAAAITESIRIRIEKGAALSSELLLGQLELERARLELAQSERELANTKDELASLWKGDGSNLVVVESDLSAATLPNTRGLESLISGSRDVAALDREAEKVDAQLNLEKADGKPSLFLSGGYRRIEADGSNTFLFGVGMPLPFFNRNQGTVSSLRAQSEAIKFMQEEALVNAETAFQTIQRKIIQLLSRYQSIDTLVLPKAKETYRTLKDAYEKGRIPYPTLLEGERTLIDLRFELNDLELAIRQEIIDLERLLGVKLHK